jgi:hypothetical protein
VRAGRESSAKGASEREGSVRAVHGSKGARACGGARRTRRRGRVQGEGRGREVRDGLTSGVRRTERVGTRARETAPIGRPHRIARGREEEKRCAGWRRQVGPACQGPKARGRGRARG